MEKKNPKMQNESNRKVYFQLGLFITSAIVLLAFTYRTPFYLQQKRIVERGKPDITVLHIPKQTSKKKEVPKVGKLPIKKKEFNLFPDLRNIKKKKNRNVDQKSSLRKGDIQNIIDGNFDLDIGEQPVLDKVYEYPNELARFDGNWGKFLGNELGYPEESRMFHEQGDAHVSFIVEKDGTVSDVKVLNKNLAEPLKKEAIRVIKSSPKWNPGSVNGEKVRSTLTITIHFVLQS